MGLITDKYRMAYKLRTVESWFGVSLARISEELFIDTLNLGLARGVVLNIGDSSVKYYHEFTFEGNTFFTRTRMEIVDL